MHAYSPKRRTRIKQPTLDSKARPIFVGAQIAFKSTPWDPEGSVDTIAKVTYIKDGRFSVREDKTLSFTLAKNVTIID